MSFSKILTATRTRRPQAVRGFERLIAPCSDSALESLAARSQELTRQHFGRTMRLFAPLYLSNECINNCKYCGFSRDNPILRVTLPVENVVAEARHLAAEGFRNVLLVAGEHPKFVSNGYLEECVRAVSGEAGVPGVSLEVGPMETAEYAPLVAAGAEALIVYQETYDRATYEDVHTSGPKRDFAWRLDCPRARVCGGFPPVGDRRVVRAGRMARGSRWTSRRISTICCGAAGRRKSV